VWGCEEGRVTGTYWITPRQAEAYRLKQMGLSNKEIAQNLGVGRQQVGMLLARVKYKLADGVKPPLRAYAARVDATQPDDPPRGVWIET